MSKWQYENDVDDYVKATFKNLGLKKSRDFNEKQAMTRYLKEALKGSAKTKTKENFGVPDFSLEIYGTPVIIENKFGSKKLVAKDKDEMKFDDKSISGYAVNGALHYARSIIASGNIMKPLRSVSRAIAKKICKFTCISFGVAANLRLNLWTITKR